MNIKKLREKAIKRYENGESPKEIYQSLGKGKTWLFKCFTYYVCGRKSWLKSKNCGQCNTPNILPKSSIDLSKIDL